MIPSLLNYLDDYHRSRHRKRKKRTLKNFLRDLKNFLCTMCTSAHTFRTSAAAATAAVAIIIIISGNIRCSIVAVNIYVIIITIKNNIVITTKSDSSRGGNPSLTFDVCVIVTLNIIMYHYYAFSFFFSWRV